MEIPTIKLMKEARSKMDVGYIGIGEIENERERMNLDKVILQKEDFNGCKKGDKLLMVLEDDSESVYPVRYLGRNKEGNHYVASLTFQGVDTGIFEISRWEVFGEFCQEEVPFERIKIVGAKSK